MGLHHLVMVCLLSKHLCLGEPEVKMMDIATLFTAQSSPTNYPLTWKVRSESQIYYSVDNVVPSNSQHINKNSPAVIKEAKLRVHRSAEEKGMNKPIHKNDSPDDKTERKVLYSSEELRSFLPEKRNPVASLFDHSDEDYTRNNFHFDNDEGYSKREGSVFREPQVETEKDKNSGVLKKEEPSNSKNIYEPKGKNISEKDEDEDELGTSKVSEYSSEKEEEPDRHIVDHNKSQFQRSEIPVASEEQSGRPFSKKSAPEFSEHNHSVTGKGFKSVTHKPSDVEYNNNNNNSFDRKFSSTGKDSYNYRDKLDGNNLSEKSSNDEEPKRTEKHNSPTGKFRTSEETRSDDDENVRHETSKSNHFYQEPDKSSKDFGRPNIEDRIEDDRMHNNYKGKPDTKPESYKKLREVEEEKEVEEKEDRINLRPSTERGSEERRWFPGPTKSSTEDYRNLPERNKEEIKEKHVSHPRKLQSVSDSPREFDVEDNEESQKPPAIREEPEEDDDDDEDNVSSIKDENEKEEGEEEEPTPRNIEQRPYDNRYRIKESQTPAPPGGRTNGRLVNRAPFRNYIPNNSRENINNHRVPHVRHPAKSAFTGRKNSNPGRVEEGRDNLGRREPHPAPKSSYKDGGKYRKSHYKPNPSVQTLPSQRGSRGRYVPKAYVSTYDGESNTISSPKPEDVKEDGLYYYGIGETDFIGLPKWESYRTKPKVKDTQHIQQEESSVNTRSTVYANQQAVLPKRRKANTYTYKEEETKPRSLRNEPNPPISAQRKYNRGLTQHRDEAKRPKSSDTNLNGNEFGYNMNNNFEADDSHKESERDIPKNVIGTAQPRGYKYPMYESPRGVKRTRNEFESKNSNEDSATGKPKTVGRGYKYSTSDSPRRGQKTRNRFKTEHSEEESTINKPKNVIGTVHSRVYKYPTNEAPKGGQKARNEFETENADERDEHENKGDDKINSEYFENTSNRTPIKENWRRNHNRDNEDEPYTKHDETEEEREKYQNRDGREHVIEDDDDSEEYPKSYQKFSKHQPIPYPATDNTEENDEQHEVVYKNEDNYRKEKDHSPHDKYYEHEDDKSSGYNPYYKHDHAPYDSDHFDYYHGGSKNERSGGADDSEREDEGKKATSREVVRGKIHTNSQPSGRGRGGEYNRGSTDDGDKLYQGSVSSVEVTQPTHDNDDDEDRRNKEDSLDVAYGAAAARRFGGASSSNAATNSHQDKHRHKGSLLQGDNCKYRRGKATNGVRDVEDWEEYGRRREYHYTLGDKELADLFGGQSGAATFGGPYNVLQYAPPFNNGAHPLEDSVNQYVFGW